MPLLLVVVQIEGLFLWDTDQIRPDQTSARTDRNRPVPEKTGPNQTNQTGPDQTGPYQTRTRSNPLTIITTKDKALGDLSSDKPHQHQNTSPHSYESLYKTGALKANMH